MYCVKCGAAIRETAHFCPKCGTKVFCTLDENGNVVMIETKTIDLISKVKTTTAAIKNQQGIETSHVSLNNTQLSHLVMDAAIFALATFFPWVGSAYLGNGAPVSLPHLAMSGLELLSQMKQYAGYANEFGMGSTYSNIVAIIAIVAIAAAIGWFSIVSSIYFDVKAELQGRSTENGGGRTILILAVVVQLVVWIGTAYVQSQLKTQYLDMSSLGNDIIQTTLWVWVSAIVGIASIRLHKSEK